MTALVTDTATITSPRADADARWIDDSSIAIKVPGDWGFSWQGSYANHELRLSRGVGRMSATIEQGGGSLKFGLFSTPMHSNDHCSESQLVLGAAVLLAGIQVANGRARAAND